jgi:hypothetical protein
MRMGIYKIIVFLDSEGNTLSQFTLYTKSKQIVMVFSDEASIAEALPYARRSASRVDAKLGMLSIPADSRSEVVQIFENASPGFTADTTLVFEGEDLFDVLMTQLRDRPD